MNMLGQLFFIFHIFIWCLHFIFSLQLKSFKSFFSCSSFKAAFCLLPKQFYHEHNLTHFTYNAVDYVVRIMIYPAFIGCSRLLWKHPSTPATRHYSPWAFWCVLQDRTNFWLPTYCSSNAFQSACPLCPCKTD